MKTADLIGPALDWAVAKCEEIERNPIGHPAHFSPSTNWSQAGPIIEREEISVINKAFLAGTMHAENGLWMAYSAESTLGQSVFGFTPLVAAMRRYVSRKLGDEIEIPDELKT